MNNISMRVVDLSNEVFSEYIFEQLNFNIGKGEVVGLFGHNGSGKSTIHRILGNLEPPAKGRVEINGIVNDFNQFRTDVVLIPDQILLFENKTIKFNFQFITKKYDVSEQVFSKLLKTLKLTADQYVSDLSKGNQEMVQMIIYFSINADVYILDEPFGAVDIFRRRFINKLFIDTILRRPQASIVITTHLIAEIEAILDRVIYIDDGAIKFDLLMDELLEVSGTVVEYIGMQFEEVGYEELLSDY